MNPQQRRLITELVKKYSERVGTESLIAFVAETNGMLAAGRTLLQSIETGDSAGTDWLFRDCLQYNVVFHSFIEETSRVIALFDPGQENGDHFATLGISPGAGRDEIKQAYRTLSLRYHPDTASSQYHHKPEKFIAINKAYQALMAAPYTEEINEKNIPIKKWRKSRTRGFSSGQKKKLFIWASAVSVVLAVVSTIASINIRNRAMLAGLQRGRTVTAVPAAPAAETVPPQKPFPAVPVEHIEATEHIAQIESKSIEQIASSHHQTNLSQNQ